MALDAFRGGMYCPRVIFSVSGTISREIRMAAGVLMIEAMRICPITSGMCGPRMVA
jgi:hypothetical protein